MSEYIDETFSPQLDERLAHRNLADTEFCRNDILQECRARRVDTREDLLPNTRSNLPAHGTKQVFRHIPYVTWKSLAISANKLRLGYLEPGRKRIGRVDPQCVETRRKRRALNHWNNSLRTAQVYCLQDPTDETTADDALVN